MQNNLSIVTYGIVKSSINLKLISSLLADDAKIIEFPNLKTEKIISDKKIQTVIDQLADFDWLIFTDVLAVDYFLEILEQRDFDLFEFDNLRVCSFGEAVADRLRFVQIHSDVIPTDLKAEKVFREISNYIADSEEFKESKFLIIKGEAEESKFCELIDEKSALAQEISIYRFIKENLKEQTKLKTLLIGGAIDEFIFTSPTDFLFVKEIFRLENLRELLGDIKISATDEITHQFLRENGFKPKMFIH